MIEDCTRNPSDNKLCKYVLSITNIYTKGPLNFIVYFVNNKSRDNGVVGLGVGI
jgi:hypothetical protein